MTNWSPWVWVAGGLTLFRFLIYREVSMPEAIVYVGFGLLAVLVILGELFFMDKEKERQSAIQQSEAKPIEDLVKDLEALKHKVNADTIAKGYRLK